MDIFFFSTRSNAKGSLDKLSKGVNEFTSGVMHFGGLVCYRFIRLTAPYIYTLGLVTVTMKYFASNSVFDPPTLDHVRHSHSPHKTKL